MLRKGLVDETTRISTSNHLITRYEQPDGKRALASPDVPEAMAGRHPNGDKRQANVKQQKQLV
jgi:hypothetical protein